MKCIVGLGNPGSKYADTRHNIGRCVVEYCAAKNKLRFEKKKSLKASVASFEGKNEPIIYAYPETFMNVSGESVAKLVQHFNLNLSRDLLILVDDIAIPYATLRLRSKGSDGGHNGLKSISLALASSFYARLRIGIGSPAGQSLEAFVLERFSAEQRELIPELLERSAEACRLWMEEPVESAINDVNSRLSGT